jgi:hypothetical protein
LGDPLGAWLGKGDTKMSREDFDGIRDYAKRCHYERVFKTPARVDYAISQFKKHGVKYELKNIETGHFHVCDKQGNLYQFWAGTGKILGQENRRGIQCFIGIVLRKGGD